MSANTPGNNDTSLIKQMTETKERTWAWGFRGLTSAVMILLAVVGWFMIDVITSLRADIKDNKIGTWQALSKLTDGLIATDRNLGILTQSVQDSVKSEQEAIERLAHQEEEHEERIRTLEHH